MGLQSLQLDAPPLAPHAPFFTSPTNVMEISLETEHKIPTTPRTEPGKISTD